jgi:hypothetical protein
MGILLNNQKRGPLKGPLKVFSLKRIYFTKNKDIVIHI